MSAWLIYYYFFIFISGLFITILFFLFLAYLFLLVFCLHWQITHLSMFSNNSTCFYLHCTLQYCTQYTIMYSICRQFCVNNSSSVKIKKLHIKYFKIVNIFKNFRLACWVDLKSHWEKTRYNNNDTFKKNQSSSHIFLTIQSLNFILKVDDESFVLMSGGSVFQLFVAQ